MLLIADNLHAQNPIVSDSLERLDPKPLQDAVRHFEQRGAEAFDLNPGYLSKRREDRLAFMVEAVQAVTSRPLLLDHPNPRVLAAGVRACREPPILNGLTGEPARLDQVLRLAAERHCQLVVLLLDQRGLSPAGLEEKAALAADLWERARAAGVPGERLMFDPLLPNLSWPDALAQIGTVVELVRLLAGGRLLGEPVRTLVGLSNIRSGLRSRYGCQYDSVSLGMLAGAGLHAVLADLNQAELIAAWRLIGQIQTPPRGEPFDA